MKVRAAIVPRARTKPPRSLGKKIALTAGSTLGIALGCKLGFDFDPGLIPSLYVGSAIGFGRMPSGRFGRIANFISIVGLCVDPIITLIVMPFSALAEAYRSGGRQVRPNVNHLA